MKGVGAGLCAACAGLGEEMRVVTHVVGSEEGSCGEEDQLLKLWGETREGVKEGLD